MNSERIKLWAQFAEIMSGVAVVISLVFLILEIRGNSDLIRSNEFNRSIESLIDFRMEVLSNEKSLKAMSDYWGVEDTDELRQQMLIVSLWSIYEKTYYSQQYGLVGRAEWERYETRICRYALNEQEAWNETISRFLTEEFKQFVEEGCMSKG